MRPQEIQGYRSHRVIFDFILGHKTGTVVFQPFGRKLYFDKGNLIFANSEKPEEHFSEILVEMQVISEDDLNGLRDDLQRGESLGKKIRDLDLASAKELAAALKQQITGIVEAIFADASAEHEVQEGQLPTKLPKLKIQTLALMLQSLMNLEDDDLFSLLPVDTPIAKTEEFATTREELDFPDAYQEFLNAIGLRDLSNADMLSRDFRWERNMTDRIIYALAMLGMVRYVPDSELTGEDTDGSLSGSAAAAAATAALSDEGDMEVTTLPGNFSMDEDLLADVLPEDQDPGNATTSQITLDDLEDDELEEIEDDGQSSFGYDTLPPSSPTEIMGDATTEPALQPEEFEMLEEESDTQPLATQDQADFSSLDDTAVEGLDFEPPQLGSETELTELDEPDTLPGFRVEEQSDTVPGQKIDLPAFDSLDEELEEESEEGDQTEPELQSSEDEDEDTNSFFAKVYPADESDTAPMKTVDEDRPFADIEADTEILSTGFGEVAEQEEEGQSTLTAGPFDKWDEPEGEDTLSGDTEETTWQDDVDANTNPHPIVSGDTAATMPATPVVMPGEDDSESEGGEAEEAPAKKSKGSRVPVLAGLLILVLLAAVALAYFMGLPPFSGSSPEAENQVTAIDSDPPPTTTEPSGTLPAGTTDAAGAPVDEGEALDSQADAGDTATQETGIPASDQAALDSDSPSALTDGDQAPPEDAQAQQDTALPDADSAPADTPAVQPDTSDTSPAVDEPISPVRDEAPAPSSFDSSANRTRGAVPAATGAAAFSRDEVDGMTRDSTSFLSNQSGNFALCFIVACEIETVNNILDRNFPGEIMVFPRFINGRRCYMMTWGLFENAASANEAKNRMPQALFNSSDPPWTVDLRKYR